jgi:hypothetical protein
MVVLLVLAILIVALLGYAFMHARRAGRSGELLTDPKAEAAARRIRESRDLYGGMTPNF